MCTDVYEYPPLKRQIQLNYFSSDHFATLDEEDYK